MVHLADNDSSGSDSDSSGTGSDSDSASSDRDTQFEDNSTLGRTINPSLVSLEVPEPVEESSIADVEPDASIHADEEVTYELVEKSSQRMKDKLIDSLGYSYNVSRRRGATMYWQCTVKKVNNCKSEQL